MLYVRKYVRNLHAMIVAAEATNVANGQFVRAGRYPAFGDRNGQPQKISSPSTNRRVPDSVVSDICCSDVVTVLHNDTATSVASLSNTYRPLPQSVLQQRSSKLSKKGDEFHRWWAREARASLSRGFVPTELPYYSRTRESWIFSSSSRSRRICRAIIHTMNDDSRKLRRRSAGEPNGWFPIPACND